jgi:hypothetical protein
MYGMKIWPAALVAVVFSLSLYAQDFQPLPPPPDVVGVPFYLDTAAGELKKLTTEPYRQHSNAGPFNLTPTISVQMQGSASPFRVPSHDKIVFVFDATIMPKLYRFTVNGKKREFAFEKESQRNTTPIDGLSTSVSKYSGGSAYQLSADERLSPGEYALVFADRIFTFGVDETK